MLLEEQIQTNKMTYFSLLQKLNIDLTEITKLLLTINYFEAPATATDFKAYNGGLCEYALELYYELKSFASAYFPEKYTEEDFIKIALFKDLYRAVMYEPYLKNVKNESSGQWETATAFRVKEERPSFGNIGFSSYMIIKNFITLTDEQIEAICNYSLKDTYTLDLKLVRKQFPLTALTGLADAAVYNILPLINS